MPRLILNENELLKKKTHAQRLWLGLHDGGAYSVLPYGCMGWRGSPVFFNSSAPPLYILVPLVLGALIVTVPVLLTHTVQVHNPILYSCIQHTCTCTYMYSTCSGKEGGCW